MAGARDVFVPRMTQMTRMIRYAHGWREGGMTRIDSLRSWLAQRRDNRMVCGGGMEWGKVKVFIRKIFERMF